MANFAKGVVDNGSKFATGVVDSDGTPWLATANLKKKIEMTLMLFSGGKIFHEKILEQKISWQYSFKLAWWNFQYRS